ncbi:hypothetical protein [Streptomyces sp. DH10]|uniref:hypothetical protein n=1 Tax=Streptomyces sp. DH10 TaxID=3040121 RepID=UPI0024414B6D|nr:hypothetical protein [Streptomyces sp. DH10]MDG9713433.1 hypothetical protein [Streptomyces sp. DH10]
MTTPASPSGQQTNLRKVFYQCQLGKGDLDSMFAMACEGIPVPEVKISTTAGETLFWKSSLEELVATVQREAPEIHGDWANLTLQASTPSQDRGVKITIDKERTEVNVSGSDTTWAFGQIARIEKFLVSRGAVFSSPKYENTVTLLTLAFFVGLGTFFVIHGVDNETVADCVRRAEKAPRNQTFFNIFMTLAFSFGLLFPFFQFLKRRALRAQLKVDVDMPRGTWWARLSNGEKIAAVTIPLTALATLGAIATAVNDLWGK